MAQFFVPLFLASVLVVVFEPVHRWISDRLPKWPRTAAMFTTVAIILLVVLPLVWLGFKAYVDFDALLSKPVVEETADQNQQQVAKRAPKLQSAPIAATTGTFNENDKEQAQLTHNLKTIANRLVGNLAIRAHMK